MRVNVLGVGFDDTSIEQAVSRACEMISGGEKAYVVTPNPEIVWMCRRDDELSAAISEAALVLPDGIGIILGAKILGTPLACGRVPGIDFVAVLFEKMAGFCGRVFLFGGKPGVAEEAGLRLSEMHPGLVIAGTADGYFDDDGPIVERINAAEPDLLLVCLGAPKQELWMARNIGRLCVPLCAGLGGSLDVFAGNVRRAPVFFQKLGLEWFYRLVCQPSRIKRMITLPMFVIAVVMRRLRAPLKNAE